MPGHHNPTVRREELAAALRVRRQAAAMNIDDVARELGISASQVSRIENAQRKASIPDVMAMCRLYAVPDDETHRLLALARGAKERPWWEQYKSNISPVYSKFIGLEDTARSILEYKSDVLPGLVQTDEYARAIIESTAAVERGEVELLVTIRSRRQEILERDDPPSLFIVLDESALWRRIGGSDTMRRQLDRLVTLSSLRHVSLRVVPFSVEAHPGLGYLFTILRVPQESVTDVVYFEGAQQGFLNRPTDVQRFIRIFEKVSVTALPADESRRFIEHVADALLSDPTSPTLPGEHHEGA